MKSLNLLSACVLSCLPFTTQAQVNPQIRVCNYTEGQFLVANSEQDQFGFCKYGESIIGTIDLLNYQEKRFPIQALQTYFDGIRSCEPYGQTVLLDIPFDRSSAKLSVCAFADGSKIGSETLKAGHNAPENKKLNDALSTLQ